MATLAPRAAIARDDRFFLASALVMAGLILTAFSTHFLLGRSTFAAPLLVHAHALVFMGWVAIYVAQTALAATGSLALHRRLGWLAAAWLMPMVVLGIAATVTMVRHGQAPFFFPQVLFLVLNPLSILTFAGLTGAAIALRRRTGWHRRLHFCGMAMLTGPAFGRLLPMPLLVPWAFEATVVAVMLFPLAGIVADLRRSGRVHPAWWWGVGAICAHAAVSDMVAYGPVGDAVYRAVTAGTPGAALPPLTYTAPPGGPLITGR